MKQTEKSATKKLKVLHNGRCYKSSEKTQRGREWERRGGEGTARGRGRFSLDEAVS